MKNIYRAGLLIAALLSAGELSYAWEGVGDTEPSLSADTTSTGKAWTVTPKIGISSLTGILGMEFQYKHWGFSLGLPTSGGARYYVHPFKHSWFGGLYAMGYGYDQDNNKDGTTYTRTSVIHAGLAAGYRWLWNSRWSLELGASVGSGQQRYSNGNDERIESALFFGPVAAFGIAF